MRNKTFNSLFLLALACTSIAGWMLIFGSQFLSMVNGFLFGSKFYFSPSSIYSLFAVLLPALIYLLDIFIHKSGGGSLNPKFAIKSLFVLILVGFLIWCFLSFILLISVIKFDIYPVDLYGFLYGLLVVFMILMSAHFSSYLLRYRSIFGFR